MCNFIRLSAIFLVSFGLMGCNKFQSLKQMITTPSTQNEPMQHEAGVVSLNPDGTMQVQSVEKQLDVSENNRLVLYVTVPNPEGESGVIEKVSDMTFRWFKNGEVIEGEVSRFLTFEKLQYSDSGEYSFEITHLTEVVRGQPVNLSVLSKPVISSQPRSLTVVHGEGFFLSVEAGGTEPLTYQWKKDGVAIVSATSKRYEKEISDSDDTASYSVEVKNSIGSAISANASVVVVVAPEITGQPQSVTVNEGAKFEFSVATTGNALSFQWRKDGVDIVGATTKEFVKFNAAREDVGSYSVVVTNIAGTVTSDEATLSINEKPRITAQPQAVTVNEGGSVTFAISVTGAAPLAYQWKKDGANITGARNASFIKTSIAPEDAGNYTVVVSNAAGSDVSEQATLTVIEKPTFEVQPQDTTVNEDATIAISATIRGSAPFTYQWKKDDIDIPGATSLRYAKQNAVLSDAGSYSLVVRNAAGSVTSTAANISIVEKVRITKQPQSITVTEAKGFAFSVDATGAAPLNFQWKKDGVAIAGATNPNFSKEVSVLADAGSYSVVVSNSVNSVESTPVTATVNENMPPVAKNLTVSTVIGVAVNFNLDATDPENDPLSFEVVSGPSSGTISGLGSGFVYTPNENFVGSDSLSYIAKDALSSSQPATVSIEVAEPFPFSNNLQLEALNQGANGPGTPISFQPGTALDGGLFEVYSTEKRRSSFIRGSSERGRRYRLRNISSREIAFEWNAPANKVNGTYRVLPPGGVSQTIPFRVQKDLGDFAADPSSAPEILTENRILNVFFVDPNNPGTFYGSVAFSDAETRGFDNLGDTVAKFPFKTEAVQIVPDQPTDEFKVRVVIFSSNGVLAAPVSKAAEVVAELNSRYTHGSNRTAKFTLHETEVIEDPEKYNPPDAFLIYQLEEDYDKPGVINIYITNTQVGSDGKALMSKELTAISSNTATFITSRFNLQPSTASHEVAHTFRIFHTSEQSPSTRNWSPYGSQCTDDVSYPVYQGSASTFLNNPGNNNVMAGVAVWIEQSADVFFTGEYATKFPQIFSCYSENSMYNMGHGQ